MFSGSCCHIPVCTAMHSCPCSCLLLAPPHRIIHSFCCRRATNPDPPHDVDAPPPLVVAAAGLPLPVAAVVAAARGPRPAAARPPLGACQRSPRGCCVCSCIMQWKPSPSPLSFPPGLGVLQVARCSLCIPPFNFSALPSIKATNKV